MTKYIDANKLKERFALGQAYFTEAIREKIDTAPMANVIPVVRCEDCRYWEPPTDIEADDGCTAGHCRNDYAPCQNQQTDMTWFCADGEREG